ncbi:cyclic nucleotide-gated ion channel 1-like [Cornus florida]|uniref:cyclic nucleotide-gated ion channel 1-like n=1 Tax=Cornus florida TaxID=4283 RepID=UPI002897E618|nr:cyclic nucleotide-gated ion channel 1-like [Cornus florida]
MKKILSLHQRKILDPEGSFLQKWNKIFVLYCVVAVLLDPLFFYIPVINGKEKCLDLDKKLNITACVLRSFIDILYLLHILFQFRTGFIAPYSRVFGRGDLIHDSYAIAKRYLSSYFIIDVLSILPFPQVGVLAMTPIRKIPIPLISMNWMEIVFLLQIITRLYRIYPLYKEVTRTSGIFTEVAWAGTAFSLFLFILAGHGLGALWYLISIQREYSCWRIACDRHEFSYDYLYCGEHRIEDHAFLNVSCPPLESNEIKDETDFDFGIFLEALQSRVVEWRNFPRKFFYCFWWGLRNLSSLGQNLKTSSFIGEILFAVFISILGLVLFAMLISNMQEIYIQPITARMEEMRVKRRDSERWMAYRMLPEKMRKRIRRYEEYKWDRSRVVDEESLVCSFPKDIRRDIKRHLCRDLIGRVPMFDKMDEQLLDEIYDRLKPVLYTENSLIVREGDPVDEMLFVMSGKLSSASTDGGRTGFFNKVYLMAGDFCGEELLTWALAPHYSASLATSTRTVQAVTDVEAFALMPDDLKFVATQYRCLHSKQLQHTFRFYSQQWRTWAACFIQSSWRRYRRMKLDKCVRDGENKLQIALAKDAGTSTSFDVGLHMSKFTTRALGALRRDHARLAKSPPRLPV